MPVKRLLLYGLLAAVYCPAQQIDVYVTSAAGDRLARKPALQFSAGAPAGPAFRIDPQSKLQQMVGFGASFLEAGMVCLNSLDPQAQEKLLRALFDPRDGAGFSAMKTVIAGTDFMSAGPWYTYDDTPGDVALEHFSIQRDLGPNGLIPYIRRARRYGTFLLQAPMDYPPDWMLRDVNKRQDVDPRYYDALAHYYLRYLREYEKQGIFIDYLSLFNEPGVYTKIPYTAIRDLLRDHVGPLFRKEGVRTRLAMSESPKRDDGFKHFPVVLDDPEARKYVDVIEYHGYGFKDYGLMSQLGGRYNLPIWMTEVCHAYEAGTRRSMPLPNLDFRDGEFWGNQIFGDVEAGASAWIYWNMILDERGGPWLVSPIHGNPEHNIQHPVVVVNRQTHEVIYTALYYYLAHFSRFVRPGAVRIGVEGKVPGVRCLAFREPDGRMVAELMNTGNRQSAVVLQFGSNTASFPLAPNSMTTAIWHQ